MPYLLLVATNVSPTVLRGITCAVYTLGCVTAPISVATLYPLLGAILQILMPTFCTFYHHPCLIWVAKLGQSEAAQSLERSPCRSGTVVAILCYSCALLSPLNQKASLLCCHLDHRSPFSKLASLWQFVMLRRALLPACCYLCRAMSSLFYRLLPCGNVSPLSLFDQLCVGHLMLLVNASGELQSMAEWWYS